MSLFLSLETANKNIVSKFGVKEEMKHVLHIFFENKKITHALL
jgi:hypothetical protein